MRGEYKFTKRYSGRRNGSSPRAWGIRLFTLRELATWWFIPTCVGNTNLQSGIPDGVTVHPHVRGEYFNVMLNEQMSLGSSPRAWGIHNTFFLYYANFWFIPTCVGNTFSLDNWAKFILVHPHVRGEYIVICPPYSKIYGSSPRAWGIQHRVKSSSVLSWFIPTCVGNTKTGSYVLSRKLVHPHVRGEYWVFQVHSVIPYGSSPRAWGILVATLEFFRYSWFIPTCVGNTW